MDPKSIKFKTTAKQDDLIRITLDGKHTRIAYGGAVGGAKTYGILFVLYLLCKIYPGSRWAVIRKNRKVIEQNTIPSFWKTAPRPFFHPHRFNKSKLIATASNGSEILFMGENYEKDKELTDFDGLEVNGAVMEEAHELKLKLFNRLQDRVGRWPLEFMPPAYIFMTFNPNQGWTKSDIYLPWQDKKLVAPYCFIPALPTDNKDRDTGESYLAQTYWDSLALLKKSAPNLYRKRVQGSWDAEDDVQQLVSWKDIWNCEPAIRFKKEDEEDYMTAMGVDVGRYGPDRSVWHVYKGTMAKGFNKIHDEGYDLTDGPEVEQKTKELILKYEIPHHRVWMDVVGLGGPCYDHVVKDGYQIQSFHGGSLPVEQYIEAEEKGKHARLFDKLNSQAAWAVKMLMEAKKLGNIDSEKLRGDIAVYRYDIKGEKTIAVWSKEIIKEKLGRSPDDGDATKYAIWGLMHDTIEPMPGIASV